MEILGGYFAHGFSIGAGNPTGVVPNFCRGSVLGAGVVENDFPACRFQMMVQQVDVVQWRAQRAAIARLLDLNLA